MHAHGSHNPFDVWNLVNPTTLLLILAVGVLYLMVTGPWRHRWGENLEAPTTKQRFLFFSGLAFLYVSGGPLHSFGHLLFSAHMLEMSFDYLVAPPLLMLGLPAWFYRPLFRGRVRKRIFSVLTHPLLTLLTFNGLMSVYHLPLVFDTIMTSGWLMTVAHTVLLISSFMMWWPMTCPLPERDQLSPLQKMAYIFADGVLLTPACAMIAFSQILLFDTYQGAPQVFAFLNHLHDQSAGGVLMKIVQEIAYGTVLGRTFFRWVREQREQDRKEEEEDRTRSLQTAPHSPVYGN